LKISIILPYWDRQEAADRALHLLDKTYAGMDLEVVIVDDGNPTPFVVPQTGLNIRLVRLPEKNEPKCPSAAWNAGVSASNGDIVVLSCIEILHEEPILAQMADALADIGPLGYVLAAAWCPEAQQWHCHSTVKVPRNPEGTGIAFCGMMYRSMWDKAGGFDDAYRDGAGYEDNDFINRMLQAGARFLIRDDLVVIHPKTGASIEWGATKFARNEKLFYEKWPQELRRPTTTFVCLNAGNYCDRGAEYVNNLFDMVRRNLSPNIKGKFVCLTDDSAGLNSGIEVLQLPADLKGWWGKLYLFKDGLFPKNERMVYFDLDTLIVNNLDDIVAYDGEFAILRDFYNPHQEAPGVMMWRSGVGREIWSEWEAQGRPLHEMGDLWWFNTIKDRLGKIDILQDIFPGKFVSYKSECTIAPPAGSSVICFHGLPRPHEVGGWVADVWKIDGVGTSELEVVNNVNHETIVRNIDTNSRRDIDWLELKPENSKEVLIVGGGPSLSGDVEEIRKKISEGAYVVALNGAASFLNGKDIHPDTQVIIDARRENLRFLDAWTTGPEVFLASQCDPSLFDLAGDATLFHVDIPNLGAYVPGDRPIQAVGGGVTVGLIAMSIAYTLGFRTMHLYGYDSSYSDDAHHAYTQPENDGEPVLEAHVSGRTFKCAPWMVVQTNQFQDLAKQLIELGCEIQVHGRGLLPTVAWAMMGNAIAA
jgi:glycosyltransferase involved in cell wall biosynthesis